VGGGGDLARRCHCRCDESQVGRIPPNVVSFNKGQENEKKKKRTSPCSKSLGKFIFDADLFLLEDLAEGIIGASSSSSPSRSSSPSPFSSNLTVADAEEKSAGTLRSFSP